MGKNEERCSPNLSFFRWGNWGPERVMSPAKAWQQKSMEILRHEFLDSGIQQALNKCLLNEPRLQWASINSAVWLGLHFYPFPLQSRQGCRWMINSNGVRHSPRNSKKGSPAPTLWKSWGGRSVRAVRGWEGMAIYPLCVSLALTLALVIIP